MDVLIYAAMVFVLQFVPQVSTSLDYATPRGVAGYVDCAHKPLVVHVLRMYDDSGVNSPFLERVSWKKQWLLAADCVDDGAINGSLAPAASDSPFLDQRAEAWVDWALGHHEEAVALLEAGSRVALAGAASARPR